MRFRRPDLHLRLTARRPDTPETMKKQAKPRNERSQQRYRGCTLVARPEGVSTFGKAWCEGRPVGTATGATEDEVMTSLRDVVDAGIVVETTDEAVGYPDTAAYEFALGRNLERLTRRQIQMLCAHYAAPRRTLDGEALAAAAGCRTWTMAYSQYVALGRALGQSMMFEPLAGKPGSPLWIRVIARNDGDKVRDEHCRWVLRDELAAALPASGVLTALQVV
jgi:hypothetical protein